MFFIVNGETGKHFCQSKELHEWLRFLPVSLKADIFVKKALTLLC